MRKKSVVSHVMKRDDVFYYFRHVPKELSEYVSLNNTVTNIKYPVTEYPKKVKSVGFDKMAEISGRLWGIKGQYLIFDDGYVLNIRKHNGYNITLET